MPTVHLHGHFNQISPPNGWERLIYLDRCVSTIHIPRHLASQIGITVWCCACSKNSLIVYNVFGAPRSVLREG